MNVVGWRRPRVMTEILFGAWRIYERHFWPLFLVALVTAPLQLLSVIVQRTASDAVAVAVTNLLVIPTVVVTVVATGALIHAVHTLTADQAVEAGSAIDAGLASFWPLLMSGLLLAAMLFLSLFAFPFLLFAWLFGRGQVDGRRSWYFLIPFVLTFYLSVRWSLYQQGVMIDGRRHWAALDVSADLVRGAWWRVFGILFVLGLTQLGPAALAGAAAVAPPLVEGTVVAVVSALVLPFSVAAQTLLYYDLKARKTLDLGVAPVATAEPDLQREGPRDI